MNMYYRQLENVALFFSGMVGNGGNGGKMVGKWWNFTKIYETHFSGEVYETHKC